MRFFVSSKICIECCKVIPLSAAGTSLDSFLWPETSWGTEHNLLALLHPIPRLDRCNGQIVISEKLVGFTKIPLLANISSISVSIPENCKKRLWLNISLLHDDSDTVWVEWCLARSSAPQTPPTISRKEQDILFLLELKQPLSLCLSPTITALLLFVYFRWLVKFLSRGRMLSLFRSIKFSLYGSYLWHLRRIYTTFILGTALLNFGTRADSFGHGPLDLHGKICSTFFNVDFWTAPLKQERHP